MVPAGLSPVLVLHRLQRAERGSGVLHLLGRLPAFEVEMEPEHLPRLSGSASGVSTGCKQCRQAPERQWTCPPGPDLLSPPHPFPGPSPPVFTGSVPLDPELTRSLEEGRDFIREFPKSPAFPALSSIAQKILNETPAQLP